MLTKKIRSFSVCATVFIAGSIASAAGSPCPRYVDENFTLTELTKIIRTEDCQVKTIRDVLVHLPERMRTRIALFYRSQSLQAPHTTDYLYPRAIMSSVKENSAPSPAMMMSFNGHPSQVGYGRLELVNLDPIPGSVDVFKYHEISFPKEETVDGLTWQQAQSQIRISEPNPAKCVQCHGQPARPIFQQYPNWTGSYGSRHTSDLPPNEVQGLRQFISLHGDNVQSRYWYLNPKRFNTNDFESSHPGTPNLADQVYFRGGGPSAKMNTDLSDYNGIRVAAVIRRSPIYEKFRFAVAAGFLGCESPRRFFPPHIFNSLKAGIDPEAKWSTTQGLNETQRKFLQLIQPNIMGGFGGMHSFTVENKSAGGYDQNASLQKFLRLWDFEPTLAGLAVDTMEKQGYDRMVVDEAVPLRFIFEGQGLPMNTWWADLKQPTYRTNSGFGRAWYENMRELDPTLPTPVPGGATCAELAKLSLAALNGHRISSSTALPQSQNTTTGEFPKVFQNTCAKCHVENEVGPRIPFTVSELMTEWLRTPGNLRKLQYKVFEAPEGRSMPPTRSLTPEEKASIASYLKGLQQ